MKWHMILGLVVAAAAFAAADKSEQLSQTAAGDIYVANKKLGRGINFGNALDAPKEGDWGVTLRAEYFQIIKEAGFQTVRLPVRWSAHASAEAPYSLDLKFAERVDWAINQALANKLSIIIDLHHYSEMHADPDKHLPRLIGLWQQIADRYSKMPKEVYFELLNEPQDKLNESKWNEVIPQVLAAVRKTNSARPVIIGPAQWNAVRAIDKLQLPADDHNIIVTVHSYDPFQFTHQGAGFVKGADKWRGTKWTGSDAEQSAIRKSFERAANWAKVHDRPIFLGEFGAFQEADMESRARWTGFVAREAERLGFSWAYWEFCSGFGAYDSKAKSWREPLKAALVN
jgi:endoglucanase